MNHPHTLSEIVAALEANATLICDYFRALPSEVFWRGDPDRWGPAHHLVHLTQSSDAITRGLRSSALPAHPTARSRTYAEVRDAAAASVAATAKERLLVMGRKAAVAPGASQEDLVRAFDEAAVRLRQAAASWTEDTLDGRALVHPLMGALTAREMLLFCVMHERHHQKRVRLMLEAGQQRS